MCTTHMLREFTGYSYIVIKDYLVDTQKIPYLDHFVHYAYATPARPA
jgi:hypothetical protein